MYLPGWAVSLAGMGVRPAFIGPTGRISYFTRRGPVRVDSVLRLLRSVRSRQENFWIGQTLVSCSSQSGLDWDLKATQEGSTRRSPVSRKTRVTMKPRHPSILPSASQAR